MGIDPVGPAIITAKRKSANLPNVSYQRAALPWRGEELFELVLSLDVLPHISREEHETAIASMGRNLVIGGFLLIVTEQFGDPIWMKEVSSICLKN